jgi:hypothetical protein
MIKSGLDECLQDQCTFNKNNPNFKGDEKKRTDNDVSQLVNAVRLQISSTKTVSDASSVKTCLIIPEAKTHWRRKKQNKS